MKFEFSEESFEIKVEPMEHGPLEKPKSLADHKWSLEVSIEAGDSNVGLTCLDPCKMPYDPHSRKLCCCAWAHEPDQMDLYMEIPVTLTHEDHTGWNWWGDDYEPGWLKAVPSES